MTTVSEVLAYLYTLAPEQMKEDWDNVGLQCGSLEQEVHRILVALDPFGSAVEAARQAGCDLLVTHHPMLFHPLRRVCRQDPVGEAVISAVTGGISVISMHTNLDAAPGGVNDVLAATLGLEQTAVLSPAGQDYGLGRYGVVQQQPLPQFAEFVKEQLGCAGVRYADAGRQVRKVAVCGGAGMDFLADAAALGCDTYVTADVKYNGFWDAKDLGVNLIDAGHYHTEHPICTRLRQSLAGRFPGLEVLLYAAERDCVQFL